MRLLTISSISISLALAAAAAGAAGGAGAGTIQYRAAATYADGTSADRLYAVRLDADSDGDGIGDDAWLRVACSGGAVTATSLLKAKAPRDAASGQASGKRMHKPFTITKEWGRTGGAAGQKLAWDKKDGKEARTNLNSSKSNTPLAGDSGAEERGYDIKTNVKGRVAADGGGGSGGASGKVSMQDFHFVSVKAGAPSLCD